MTSTRPVVTGSLLLALLLAPGVAASPPGLVCAVPHEAPDLDCLFVLLLGITEEPDPITMTLDEVRSGSSRESQAESGYQDLQPQVATGGGITVVVWADTESGSGDIVFSEWRPDGWHETYLTLGGGDERDPRVDIADNGTIYVVWWERDEPRQVRVARRDPLTLTWDMPPEFDGLFGSRPAVVAVDDEVLVGYERRVWSGGQEVVVHRVDEAGATSETVLAQTSRESPLLIELHDSVRTFIDWIHSDGYFGYSEYDDARWGVVLDTRPLTPRAHPARRGVELLTP